MLEKYSCSNETYKKQFVFWVSFVVSIVILYASVRFSVFSVHTNRFEQMLMYLFEHNENKIVCKYIYIYMYKYACVYEYIYIYIYTVFYLIHVH